MLGNKRHRIGLMILTVLATVLGIDARGALQAQSERDRDGLKAIIEGRGQPFSEAPMKAGGPKATEPATPTVGAQGTKMEKLTGVWIEGPGFEITYGGTYEGCAERCLGNQKCAMVEYYFPEKKCNLYNTVRPRIKGGSSIVGIRK